MLKPDLQDLTSGELEQAGYSAEAVAFLGISQLPGVGPQTLRRIGNRAAIRTIIEEKSAESFVQTLVKAGGRPSLDQPSQDWDQLRRVIWSLGRSLVLRLLDKGVTLLFSGDDRFP